MKPSSAITLDEIPSKRHKNEQKLFYFVVQIVDLSKNCTFKSPLTPLSVSYQGLILQSPFSDLPQIHLYGTTHVEFVKCLVPSVSSLFLDANSKADRMWVVEYLLKKCLRLKKVVQKDILSLRRNGFDICPMFYRKSDMKIANMSTVRSFIQDFNFCVEIPDFLKSLNLKDSSSENISQYLQGMIVSYRRNTILRVDGFISVLDKQQKIQFSKSVAIHASETPMDFIFPQYCKLSGINCMVLDDILSFLLSIHVFNKLLSATKLLKCLELEESTSHIIEALEHKKNVSVSDNNRDIFIEKHLSVGIPSVEKYRKIWSHPHTSVKPINVFSHESDNTRLAVIGTVVIKFILGVSLYHTCGLDSEGVLTKKLSQVNNKKIRIEWANSIDIRSFLSSNGVDVGNKGLVTGIEALVGAVFLSSGLNFARKLVSKLLRKSSSDFQVQCSWKETNVMSCKGLFYLSQDCLDNLQDYFGFQVGKESLYETAFVHHSFSSKKRSSFTISSNERLEFLGDLVLELVVCHQLYSREELSPSEMVIYRSLLVRNETLVDIMIDSKLTKFILFENAPKNDKKYIADAFEAIIGALFLDQNEKTVYSVIEKVLLSRIESTIANQRLLNPKNSLQELCHEKFKYSGSTAVYPSYSCVQRLEKVVCEVSFDGNLLAVGEGITRVEAEKCAARNAVDYYMSK